MPEQTETTKLRSHFLKIVEKQSVTPIDVYDPFISGIQQVDFFKDGLRYFVRYSPSKRGKHSNREQMYANVYVSRIPTGGGFSGSINAYLHSNDRVYHQTVDRRKIKGIRLERFMKQIEEELNIKFRPSFNN